MGTLSKGEMEQVGLCYSPKGVLFSASTSSANSSFDNLSPRPMNMAEMNQLLKQGLNLIIR